MSVYSNGSVSFSKSAVRLRPMWSAPESEEGVLRARPGGISEQEFHACVDGMLEPRDQTRVEDYLFRHPRESALVDAYRAQTKALYILFGRGPTALPPTLKELADRLEKVMVRASVLRTILLIVVVILVLLVGLSVGLLFRQ